VAVFALHTLATNDSSLGSENYGAAVPIGRMRDLLREFDGRMTMHSRQAWARRDSDRIWAFWFLEEAEFQSAWHGLVRFFQVDDYRSPAQEAPLDDRLNRFGRARSGGSVH